VSHYKVSPITESPAGDSVAALQNLPRHVDVSHPMAKSPPYDKVVVVGVTESPPRQSLPLPQPGNEHPCKVNQRTGPAGIFLHAADVRPLSAVPGVQET